MSEVAPIQGNELFMFENIPAEYYQTPIQDLLRRGREIKEEMGKDLMILAHHYQQDDTFALADHAGDSLYLAQKAANSEAKYIVFCGVHFMVESADIVTRDDQIAILPNLTAGCSMADMADEDALEAAWEHIVEVTGDSDLIPVTYINSTAAIKAFCATKGGTVCTSSNAETVLKWAFTQGKRVFFVPDQFLGRNTARIMGIQPEEMVLWKREKDDGGATDEALKKSKVIFWDGFCSVHMRFTKAHVDAVRKRIPGVKVIVHPECPDETVQAADYYGSTGKILKVVTEAEHGTKWAIGTEINMVRRLAAELKAKHNKHIEVLNPNVCICSTMYRNHPAHVLWVLDAVRKGEVINQILVEPETKRLAKIALDRMLSLS